LDSIYKDSVHFQEAHEKGYLVTLQNGSLAGAVQHALHSLYSHTVLIHPSPAAENTFLSAYFYDVFSPAVRKFLSANMKVVT
jgi:hypothetical protein